MKYFLKWLERKAFHNCYKFTIVLFHTWDGFFFPAPFFKVFSTKIFNRVSNMKERVFYFWLILYWQLFLSHYNLFLLFSRLLEKLEAISTTDGSDSILKCPPKKSSSIYQIFKMRAIFQKTVIIFIF